MATVFQTLQYAMYYAKYIILIMLFDSPKTQWTAIIIFIL